MAGKPAIFKIDVVTDVKEAIEGFDKLGATVESKTGGGFDKTKAAIAGLGVAIGGELTVATKAAMDHEKIVAQLNNTYTNAGLSVKEAGKAMEEIEASTRRTGQGTEDATAAYGKLVLATKDSTKAMDMLHVAQDLAAKTGTDVTTAATSLISAQQGQTRGLKQLGIQVTDASGKTLDFNKILENTKQAVNGAADAAGDTAAGKMARFHQSIEQTQEKIGTALIPALNSLLTVLQPLFDWLGKNQAIVSKLVPPLAILAGIILGVVEAVKVWTMVQTALDVVLNANPIGLIILAIAALVAGVVLAYQHFSWFRTAVNDVWNVIKAVVDFIKDHWQLAVEAMFGPLAILIMHFDTFKQLLSDVIGFLSKVVEWIGKIASAPVGIIGKIAGIIPHAGGGNTPTQQVIVIQTTPGRDFPETVYYALRRYQMQHQRPELAAVFG
jgi:hypothetical protein